MSQGVEWDDDERAKKRLVSSAVLVNMQRVTHGQFVPYGRAPFPLCPDLVHFALKIGSQCLEVSAPGEYPESPGSQLLRARAISSEMWVRTRV
jgi:hypothetical protein